MEGDHAHCLSCVNHRCMVRLQPGISCDLITCPLVCGAVFHSCKLGEHNLLCPLLRVPCLNSGYGCPVTLVRNQMYSHLEVCPAGVVCCTMEWNRWPVSCLDYTSYESLSHGVEEMEQLDMALALQDQRTLLESLKVIAIAPTAEKRSSGPVSKISTITKSASLESFPDASTCIAQPSQSESSHHTPATLPGSARDRIDRGINGLNEQHFTKLYEATLETARSLATALNFVSSSSSTGSSTDCLNGDAAAQERFIHGSSKHTVNVGDEQNVCSSCFSGSGAQRGTRQKNLITTNEVIDDTNAGVSDHQLTQSMTSPAHAGEGVAQRACHVVLEKRGLVLENHKPDWTLHSQQLLRGQNHSSLLNGQIGFIRDRSLLKLRPKMDDKAVDTSDLETGDDPMGLGEIDLITAALLFCLEESRECRRISDTVYVDGVHVDFGTQTFTFPATILVTNTRVGDMASASACDHAAPQLSYPSPYRTLRLGLVLEALEVEAVPHNCYLPPNPRYQHMFPFVCGQSFRRDQFSSHFSNVHGDIHAGLNGWMEHRCPLAYYGCTFSQRRFYPSSQGAKVVHDRHLRSFGVRPCPGAKLADCSQSDQFSRLPIEILWHIADFLDSFSLCQLSLVSRPMREVCASLLQTRGIVELQWERRQWPGAHGTVSWQIKNKVWRFSTAFSPVLKWGYSDLPSMSDHLKKCHYNAVAHKTEPVPLPAMCPARDEYTLRRALRHVNF